MEVKAFVFSIGESTTDLCCNLLSKYGFDVYLWRDDFTLKDKLKRLYQLDEDKILRIDADIIPNRNVLNLWNLEDGCWWHQSVGWDWYKHDVGPISVSVMNRQSLEIGRGHIEEAQDTRPETYIWRLQEFHWPRRCHIANIVTGLHGYGQLDQRDRIKKLKEERHQNYDWDLVERIEQV